MSLDIIFLITNKTIFLAVWCGSGQEHKETDQGTLIQMTGREGRPGFDTSGTSVIMTNEKSKSKYEELTNSVENCESRLLSELVKTVSLELSQKLVTNSSQAIQ